MKSFISIALVFFVISLSGCVSLNSLQSGRTLGKGNANLESSLTIGKYAQNSAGLQEGDYDNVPMVEVGAKYGISENLDLSLRLNSASLLTGQIKYQFIGDKASMFATSIGADASIFTLLGIIHFQDYYLSVPLYLSIHPSDKFCIYLTPRYSFSSFYEFEQDKDSVYKPAQNLTYGSFSYGIMIGKKNKFIFEITHSQNRYFEPTQVSFGFTSTFDMKNTKLYKSLYGK